MLTGNQYRGDYSVDDIVVYKITRPGFGSKAGQLPMSIFGSLFAYAPIHDDLPASMLSRMRKLQADPVFRCKREGFIPYKTNGKMLDSAKADQVPEISDKVELTRGGEVKKAPHFLVLLWKFGVIAASAFLFPEKYGPYTNIKLEYLCAAPYFKGSGSFLLNKLDYIFKGGNFDQLVLNNNSDWKRRTDGQGRVLPGYYDKMGFDLVGKTENPLYNPPLDVYAKQLHAPRAPPRAPIRTTLRDPPRSAGRVLRPKPRRFRGESPSSLRSILKSGYSPSPRRLRSRPTLRHVLRSGLRY